MQVMSNVKGKGGHLAKSRSGSKLREQKSVPGLLTVEEEGKENLGPDMAGVLGGKVEKDGVVEAREVEREEWKGEVRSSFSWIFCFINTFTQIRHSPSPGLSRRDSISSQLFSPLRETDISFPGTASKVL